MLRVVGKGNKERSIELEPAGQRLLQKLLTSKARMERLRLAPSWVTENPSSIPLFLNRFGMPLSGQAIGEAFLEATSRCGIKRTPHELRHEFAVAYLVNTYRGLAEALRRDGLDAWLARLMVDQTSLAIVKLSRLLGHASPETTKRVYLDALLQSEPSVREAWNAHLDSLEIDRLAA